VGCSTKEKKRQHGSGNLGSGEILFGGMVSDLLSGVLQISKGITRENSEPLGQKEVAKSI